MPTAIAAPVSEHGSGIGWGRAVPTSTHTIAIYASEEDARQLIREQLAEAGIELDASDHILPAI